MTPTECTYFFFIKEQANSSRLIHYYSENEFDTARHFILKKVSVDFLSNVLLNNTVFKLYAETAYHERDRQDLQKRKPS